MQFRTIMTINVIHTMTHVNTGIVTEDEWLLHYLVSLLDKQNTVNSSIDPPHLSSEQLTTSSVNKSLSSVCSYSNVKQQSRDLTLNSCDSSEHYFSFSSFLINT